MIVSRLNIDVYNNEITPFFQTTEKNRIRFLSQLYYKYRNRGLLRKILEKVLEDNALVKGTFIVGYFNEGSRHTNTIGLNKVLKITNWKETIIDYGENIKLIYAEVNFRSEDVFKLIFNIIEDRIYGPIVFQTRQYIVYISTDVLDIMAEEVQISQLKKEFSGYYNRL